MNYIKWSSWSSCRVDNTCLVRILPSPMENSFSVFHGNWCRSTCGFDNCHCLCLCRCPFVCWTRSSLVFINFLVWRSWSYCRALGRCEPGVRGASAAKVHSKEMNKQTQLFDSSKADYCPDCWPEKYAMLSGWKCRLIPSAANQCQALSSWPAANRNLHTSHRTPTHDCCIIKLPMHVLCAHAFTCHSLGTCSHIPVQPRASCTQRALQNAC